VVQPVAARIQNHTSQPAGQHVQIMNEHPVDIRERGLHSPYEEGKARHPPVEPLSQKAETLAGLLRDKLGLYGKDSLIATAWPGMRQQRDWATQTSVPKRRGLPYWDWGRAQRTSIARSRPWSGLQ
jgi:hypothetical protein